MVVRSNHPELLAQQFVKTKFNVKDVYSTNLSKRKKQTPLHMLFHKKTMIDFDKDKGQVVFKEKQKRIAAGVNALLLWGCDPNAQDYAGRTGLHLAMTQRNVQAVEHLLKANANPNMRNNSGDTPLLALVKQVGSIQYEEEDPFVLFHHDVAPCIKKIIERNPDITIQNDEGNTVLTILDSTKKKNSEAPPKGSIREIIQNYADGTSVPSLVQEDSYLTKFKKTLLWFL